MKNLKNTNKGITLIALVITIIVMLILVAVTITMTVNGGLFDYAGKATSETQNAIDAEQQLADGKIKIDGKWYDSIDDYINNNPSEDQTGDSTGDSLPTYAEANFENGLLTENATYTSGAYTAVVPKGFAIVPGLNGTTTIADGLVITDELDENGNSIGNEFVWIPVTVTETDTETSIAAFYRSNWEEDAANGGKRGTTKYTDTSGNSYNEPYANGYTIEATEYNAMLKSVYENHGFYIGRYEAGSTTARTNVANGTTEMVVKRDAYPYNFVGWGLTMTDYTSDVLNSNLNQGKGALALSKAMYANKDVGVTSTLCYGIQWDAMLDFIKDNDHNVTNSTTWGNYINNAWTIDRKTARYTTSPFTDTTWSLIDDEEEDSKTRDSSTKILLTTGASDDFAAKNIFDVAGNVCEWTNEALSANYRVLVGGGYSLSGVYCPASCRSSLVNPSDPSYCVDAFGFRPVLYVS